MAAKSVLGWEPFARRFCGRVLEAKFQNIKQGERLSTLLELVAWICRREARHWIEFCLEKVVNDTWNEYNASFYLRDCFYGSHKIVDPIVPSRIQRNALLKTWQSHDLLTAGSEILPRHKRIYLSSRPWLPTVTMPDHRVLTTFTLVKLPLSSGAFTNWKYQLAFTRGKSLPW